VATVKTFEELNVWQKARTFCKEIHLISTIGTFAKDFSLKDQINGASGSIMDNIAEGFERNGSREFIQFLSYSKGSTGEARSQLYRAFDKGHITEEKFEYLKNTSIELSKMISGLIAYLQQSNLKGSKFMEPSETYEVGAKIDLPHDLNQEL
jgi:four helix bundle protein